MERTLTHARFLVCMVLLAALWPVAGYCQTEEEIFSWTAHQMGLEGRFSMPPIRYVDSEALKLVFVENNRKAYLRWESEYGPDKAEKILKLYLDDIIGLFDIRTGVIYVGSFLTPCRREAILAHEVTHYLQIQSKGAQGAQPVGWSDNEALHATREMAAYKMEEVFTETFCSATASK